MFNFDNLPSLELMTGRQYFRLQGVSSWEDVSILGKANLDRLLQVTQENIYRLMTDISNQDDLKAIRKGVNFINEKLIPIAIKKPLLPRLRSESFVKGDKVLIYLGDTISTIINSEDSWVKANIEEVEKSYKSDWFDGSANSGYYWRLTAKTSKSVFENGNLDSIPFSTSEPRVLLDWEYNYLTTIKDVEFLEIFSKNAWRTWLPLWCLEKNLSCDVEKMNMKVWLGK
jgi:hypothetical protein